MGFPQDMDGTVLELTKGGVVLALGVSMECVAAPPSDQPWKVYVTPP